LRRPAPLRRLFLVAFLIVALLTAVGGIFVPSEASITAAGKGGPSGVYIFYDWQHLSPQNAPIVGGHIVATWKLLQPNAQAYDWGWLDRWMAQEYALGKPVAFGIDTYEGPCCGGMGVPDYVFQAYPSAKLVCPDGEAIPAYWDAGYQAEYRKFIQALGKHYNGDPHIAFIEIGTGIFGETSPAMPVENTCLSAAGLTSDKWVAYVEQVIDAYAQAFPDTALVMEYAPRYLLMQERRLVTDYAAIHGVGLQHSGLKPDGDSQIIDDPNVSFYGTGQYDPMFKWSNQVPLVGEGTQTSGADDAAATMWRIYNALDKHADFILLDYPQVTDPARWDMIRFANQYLGRTLADTPGVWTTLRETEYTWYPEWGNYQFWLYQNDAVPGGRTVPLWRIGNAPEGRYTRRTDAANGNPDMYFNVDDGYIYGGTNQVTVSVVYLDHGTDTWELQYDSTGDAYRSAGVITKGNTDQWLSATFELNDAQFANREAGGSKSPGSDFRILSRGDGDETIHFVQVTAHARSGSLPTSTPQPATTPAGPSSPATEVPSAGQASVAECLQSSPDFVLDGALSDWVDPVAIRLDRDTAEYVASDGVGPRPSPNELSANVWCAWRGDALVLAADVTDDTQTPDAASISPYDTIDFALDGAFDRAAGGFDDHLLVVATDGSVADLGGPPPQGVTAAVSLRAGGWSVELYIPSSLLRPDPLGSGQQAGFTVALQENDGEGGATNSMIWRGQSAGDPSGYGTLLLSGGDNTVPVEAPVIPPVTPTPTPTPMPTPTSAPAAVGCNPEPAPPGTLNPDVCAPAPSQDPHP